MSGRKQKKPPHKEMKDSARKEKKERRRAEAAADAALAQALAERPPSPPLVALPATRLSPRYGEGLKMMIEPNVAVPVYGNLKGMFETLEQLDTDDTEESPHFMKKSLMPKQPGPLDTKRKPAASARPYKPVCLGKIEDDDDILEDFSEESGPPDSRRPPESRGPPEYRRPPDYKDLPDYRRPPDYRTLSEVTQSAYESFLSERDIPLEASESDSEKSVTAEACALKSKSDVASETEACALESKSDVASETEACALESKSDVASETEACALESKSDVASETEACTLESKSDVASDTVEEQAELESPTQPSKDIPNILAAGSHRKPSWMLPYHRVNISRSPGFKYHHDLDKVTSKEGRIWQLKSDSYVDTSDLISNEMKLLDLLGRSQSMESYIGGTARTEPRETMDASVQTSLDAPNEGEDCTLYSVQISSDAPKGESSTSGEASVPTSLDATKSEDSASGEACVQTSSDATKSEDSASGEASVQTSSDAPKSEDSASREVSVKSSSDAPKESEDNTSDEKYIEPREVTQLSKTSATSTMGDSSDM